MSFYIHRGRLEAHTDQLSNQLVRIRRVKDQIRDLIHTGDGTDDLPLRQCLNELESVERCLKKVRTALLDHSDDTAAFSREISDKLDDMLIQATRISDL